MRHSTPVLLSVAIVLIVTLACAAPVIPAPTEDLSFLGTAIMGTMISGATQTAAAGAPTGPVETATPFPTFTALPPTFTASATLPPAPVFTATSVVPLVSVSVPTNCRVGPGKVYDRVGGLVVGELAEVVGRNPTGNYWFIRNPDQASGFCWLWGEYATLSGNVAALPILTPPPTPTPVPAFRSAFDGLESCNGWWADFRLKNTGGVSFESVAITVRDTTNDVVVSLHSDVFQNIDGCNETSSKDALHPGARRIVSGPVFTYNPTGHKLRATITLCTREGQNGFCLTEKITFTP